MQTDLIEVEAEKLASEAKLMDKEISLLNDILTEGKSILKHMNRSDINELRSFANPPDVIQQVLIATSLVLGEKGDWHGAKNVDSTDVGAARHQLLLEAYEHRP